MNVIHERYSGNLASDNTYNLIEKYQQKKG